MMKIEIWSDVACPFCYIGKRKLERALERAGLKDQVEITWKSFQLDPEARFEEGMTALKSLSAKKGWTEEQTLSIFSQVSSMGREQGIDFDFQTSLPANTFDAHQLLHLAAHKNVQNDVKERLFSAYFSEGKNISDIEVLKEIALSSGIEKNDVTASLHEGRYKHEVETDIQEAMQLGVRGVPFFVFNRKFALSGAQPDDVFDSAIKKASE